MFRFRLQKILDLRQREEDECQRTLAQAQRHRMEVESALQKVCSEREDFDRRCALPDSRPLRPLDLQTRRARVLALSQRQMRCELDLGRALQLEEEARRAVVEAHRAVEVLRRLREKAQRQWQAEKDAQERKELDDISSRYGALRRRSTATPAGERG